MTTIENMTDERLVAYLADQRSLLAVVSRGTAKAVPGVTARIAEIEAEIARRAAREA